MKFLLVLSLLVSSSTWAKWSVSIFNIRNFDQDMRSNVRTDLVELAKIVKSVKSDAMGFVEVVNAEALKTFMNKNLPDYKYTISSCGGFGKQKLALAYNPKVFELITAQEDFSFSGSAGCGSLRPVYLVTLKKMDTNEPVIFALAHLKAGGNEGAYSQRWIQYKKLAALANTYKGKNLIVLGDLNTTGYTVKDRDYSKFVDFLVAADFKTTSEDISCSSYWSGGQGFVKNYQPSILDHIVVPSTLNETIIETRVGSHCEKVACRPATPDQLGKSFKSVSDHCPIQVTFK